MIADRKLRRIGSPLWIAGASAALMLGCATGVGVVAPTPPQPAGLPASASVPQPPPASRGTQPGAEVSAPDTADATPADATPEGAARPRATPDTAGASSEAWLGLSMRKTDSGVFVNGVLRGSPAAGAGLMVGDRLVRVGGQPISTPVEVAEVVKAHPVGTRLDLHVLRGSDTRMLYAVTAAKPDREMMIRNELVGFQAPSISELRTVQGAVVPAWAQLRGQVVVLEFWASWCVACRALAPTLNAWHEELAPTGVHILGITMDPYEEAVRASSSLQFPTFSDESGDVTLRYQGTALPTVIVVDRQGIVRDVMVGLDFERLPSLKRAITDLASAQVTPER